MADDLNKRINVQYILDAEGFNEGLTGINKNLKLSESELKNASAGVQNLSKNSEGLTRVQQVLTDKMDLQNKKVQLYRDYIDKATQKLQDNISARDKLKSELDMEKAKLEGATQAYGKESEVTQNCKQRVEELTAEYKEKEKAVQSNSNTVVTYTTNMNKAEAEMKKTQSELNNTNKQLAENQNKWLAAGKSMETAGKKMKDFGSSMADAGNTLTLGVTVPIVGIGAAATKMAMEAIESENLFEVSMGDMADSTRKWSDQVSKSLGLNAYEVRQNVGTFNVMLISMGQTEKAAQKMSEGLTTLAYDMASFYNIKPEEAFEKLKSGISGETEPLKALGILINDNAVQQYALAKGIAKTNVNMATAQKAAIECEKAQKQYNDAVKAHGKSSLEAREASADLALKEQAYQKALKGSTVQLTDDEKVQARYGLILQATSKAQGDLARTLDSPTNKLRIETEQLKQQGIELGMKLIPIAERGMNILGEVIKWYDSLSDSQKDEIIKLAMIAAAAGPVLSIAGNAIKIGGELTSVIGNISTALGTASTAAKVATDATQAASAAASTAATAGEAVAGAGEAAAAGATAAGTAGTEAAGGLAGFGSSLAGAAAAVGPFALAIAGAAAEIAQGYQLINTQAAPAIDLFANKSEEVTKEITDRNGQIIKVTNDTTVKISEATKKAVGAYINMDDGARNALSDLYENNTTLTNKTASSMEQRYAQMGKTIADTYDKSFNDTYNAMKDFYSKSEVFDKQAEDNTLIALQDSNAKKKQVITDYENQIKGILQRAVNDHRALSSTEQQQINDIQNKMRTNAVTALSKSELESKVILERLKDYGTHITAEQASAEIKNANKARDGAVKAANDKYQKTVESIIRLRDESHTITADQADKMIAEAKRQRDGSITQADMTRQGVVDKITSMNSDVSKNVDLTTGNMMTALGRFKQWWASWHPEEKTFTYTIKASDMKGSSSGGGGTAKTYHAYAAGTNYYPGGPAISFNTTDERGYEIKQFPTGTKIFNHDASEDYVKKAAEAVAINVLNRFQGTSSNNPGIETINVVGEIIMDGKKVAIATFPHIERQQGMSHKMYGRGYGLK